MRKLVLLAFVAVFAVSAAKAAEPLTTKVSRDAFIKAFPSLLAEKFCEKEQIFKKCTSISETDCRKTAADLATGCIDEVKGQIPKVLIQPRDGTAWGRKLGTCAGGRFFEKVRSRSPASVDLDCIKSFQLPPGLQKK